MMSRWKSSPPIDPLRRWPTEVFLLCGADRAELRSRLARLADALSSQREIALADLAFTLSCCLPSRGPAEGVRLAVVAGSVAQLGARLAQALERLADPLCRQIHDAQGIYFTAQPLYAPGRLAVLFPGEGSPYVNMLADLVPHFPEVGGHFERCDRVFLETRPGQTPPSRCFLLPDDSPPETRRQAAEQMLHIDRAVSAVLIANWAVYLLLLRLRLKPDAVVGHSSGELSALAAAGAIVDNDRLLHELFATAEVLDRAESAGQLARGALLAAATSAQPVERLLAETRTHASAWVAMDNCPHQTVVGGRPEAIDALRQRLEAEGVLCEVLPFARPYHTRLFEPHVGPIARLYERIDMEAPRLPVYSCASAARMPAEVDQLRRLAVGQWSQRVQFSRTLEAMYEDGIRVFLEVGPRSNLTSFATDVLRGRPILAVATNVPHRDGLTQLNHAAGQLFVHGVPLELKHFYSRRRPKLLDWAAQIARPAGTSALSRGAPRQSAGACAAASPAGNQPRAAGGALMREAVMARHLQVMEQFLNLQQRVHEQFLDRLRAHPPGKPPASKAPPGKPPAGNTSASRRRKPAVESAVGSAAETAAQETRPARAISGRPELRPGRPMLGKVLSYTPSRRMVLRREVDLNEDLYALDHTLGGRFASALEPDYHGLAVMPMAMTLEWMAEAALAMVPGQRVIGLNQFKQHRWIPLFADPVALELSAELMEIDAAGVLADANFRAAAAGELPPGTTHAIRMTLRDLGNAHQPPVSEHPAAQAVVLLGTEWPLAPAVDDFVLSDEQPCPLGPPDLYRPGRMLFHGPAFQAVAPGGRMGRQSIEGYLRVLSHAGLFASCAEPELVLAPVVIDASTHLLGVWHLAQPDQTGRVVFPYGLGTVRFYGPRPAEGALLKCQVTIESSTDRQVMHRIDIFSAEGPLWCRLYPAQYWRFYWPQSCVRFFRHHDQQLASQALAAAPAAAGGFPHEPRDEAAAAGTPAASGTLPREPGDEPAASAVPSGHAGQPLNGALPQRGMADEKQIAIRWMPLARTPDLVQPVIRAAVARVSLSPAEWQTYYTLQGPDKRRTEMAFGHLTAKDCVRELLCRRSGKHLFPVDLEIEHDAAGRPRVRYRGPERVELPAVSLSHTDGAVAAIAAYGAEVGIDIERLVLRPAEVEAEFVQAAFDAAERQLLDEAPLKRSEALLRLWCAKEAVGKALGVGLAAGPHALRVRRADWTSQRVGVVLDGALAARFPQAAGQMLVAWTSRHEDYVVAISFAQPAEDWSGTAQ